MFKWPFSKIAANDSDSECALEDEIDADRRDVHRKDVYADAIVLSHEGTCVNDAILLDISESGARLRFSNNAEIDGPLWIKIRRFRIELEATPVWRSRTDVGVEFVY